MSEIRLMRLQEVLRIIPVSKASWYNGMRDGKYPKPVKLSVRSVAWKSADIEDLISRLSNGGWESESTIKKEVI